MSETNQHGHTREQFQAAYELLEFLRDDADFETNTDQLREVHYKLQIYEQHQSEWTKESDQKPADRVDTEEYATLGETGE